MNKNQKRAIMDVPTATLLERASALEDRQYLMAQRQALLYWLDALERRLGLEPRTAELRKEYKKAKAA